MQQWSEDKIHISTGISKMRSTREMRARRKRSRCMQEIILVGMFYVNVRLAIDPSLAKISEADSRIAASTSDYYAMIKNLHPLLVARKKNTSATPIGNFTIDV